MLSPPTLPISTSKSAIQPRRNNWTLLDLHHHLRCSYVKVALLPNPPAGFFACCTHPVTELEKPTFGEVFPFPIQPGRLVSKSLRINVWAAEEEEQTCLVRPRCSCGGTMAGNWILLMAGGGGRERSCGICFLFTEADICFTNQVYF